MGLNDSFSTHMAGAGAFVIATDVITGGNSKISVQGGGKKFTALHVAAHGFFRLSGVKDEAEGFEEGYYHGMYTGGRDELLVEGTVAEGQSIETRRDLAAKMYVDDPLVLAADQIDVDVTTKFRETDGGGTVIGYNGPLHWKHPSNEF